MNTNTNNAAMTNEALTDAIGKLDYRVRGHIAAFTARLNKMQVGGIAPTASKPNIDAESVRAIIRDEVAKAQPTVTQVVVNGHEPRTVNGGKRVHKMFEKALRKLMAGVPVMLVGPAGSGKTTLAKQLAEALADLTGGRYSFNSMSEGVGEYELLGRPAGANLDFELAPFARTYQDGGLHLFDEFDASDPNVLVSINAAIANGVLSIPKADRIIERHQHAYIIVACNTYGLGPDRQYTGRTKLDAATVDRFVMGTIECGYDTDLERDLAIGICGEEKARELLAWAWEVRGKLSGTKSQRIMSMRTVENAAKVIASGDSLQEVKDTYFQSWSSDERRAIGV